MDFSVSKLFRVEEVIDQSIGRVVLSAPETVSGQTSSKSDIWSCGIILFILLCGEPPIIANSRNKLINKFKSCTSLLNQSSYVSANDASAMCQRRARRWCAGC
jgi:serine/threonine protein kinase